MVEDKEFDATKDPISNLINSILRTMEDVQWNMVHRLKGEGGTIGTAIKLLTQCENRILIPEEETQIIADRKRLNYSADFPVITIQEVQPMINRFNQFLARGIFADKHGFRMQNPNPTHISIENQIGNSPILENPEPEHIG
jgi:hypothetical protein